MDKYDAIIVGAGPAGIFAALTLAEAGYGSILMVEQGRSIHDRRKSRRPDILTGWGGGGAFSDGKLTLSPEVGGFLGELITPERMNKVLRQADETWLRYGAPKDLINGSPDQIEAMKIKARLAGMLFVPSPVRHIGTDRCHRLLADIQAHLEPLCDIRTETRAEELIVSGGRPSGLTLSDGSTVQGERIVCAPGRVGNDWMREQAEKLGLATRPNPVDIGVRVELPAAVMADVTDTFYESKLIHYSSTFDDKIRTFCMNPYGEVVVEKSGTLTTVNGHSYSKARSDNTNFALLVSATFTEPFDDPIAYGRSVTKLANLLSEGAIVQRFGDLMAGRRTTKARLERCLTRPTLTEATPGDLAYVLPYRILQDIIEMMEAMDKLTPGLADRHTLLYGVEVKFYSHRVELSPSLETSIPGLYIIGDGAGITRGLIQASASGIIAGEAILASA